ncbi:MAG TPA: SRPBCC family protein [Opitutaceae bacterium]
MKSNDEYGQFTAPNEVRLVRLLPGPIERIWEYLVDDEKRSRWFAGGSLEQRQGGKVRLVFNSKTIAPDEPYPAGMDKTNCSKVTECTVTRFEPPRVLGYTFGSTAESEVIFELFPYGNQVQLVLTHRSYGKEDIEDITNFAAGWHTCVAQLVAEAEGKPHPPFWSMYQRMQQEYAEALGRYKASRANAT